MTEASVLTEVIGATLRITLNRPDKRNPLDPDTRDLFGKAVLQARDDDAIRAVVITGAGGCFSAGGDIAAMSAERRPAFASRARIKRMHHWMAEFINLEKPVIAAVDGYAFGAGFNLALAADFVLGTPTTRFCSVFPRIGLVPDLAGMFLLPRVVGLMRAKEIAFTTRVIEPQEALRLGILYAVHPSEQVQDEALALAANFHNAPPDAIGITKVIMNQSFNLDQRALMELESAAQGMAMESEYYADAARRFLHKEPPRFTWGKKK